MYSVQMVLEQARAGVRAVHEEQRQHSQLILAAYAQVLEAQSAIEGMHQRMVDELRHDPNKTAAA